MATDPTASNPSASASPLAGGPAGSPVRTSDMFMEREIQALRKRLIEEAATVIGMVETATEALTRLDPELARVVISRDDQIDTEEVHIEEECFRLLTLYQPFARDFRKIASMLRVNADLERVADHATSICKQTVKLKDRGATKLPTALTELAQRVPMVCHALLNAFVTENADAARDVISRDRAIDSLDKKLFEECLDVMGDARDSKATGILMYRCGREMERIGDLMSNIAEDVIYLVSGHIVRHSEKKRLKKAAQG
ncbi:MAG: phosphate signaling complex protein PhoU [Planctomycetaceae bacterium]|jgi:phosphate transport system protein|nr:phosphate signaling complex protein PhoU [Planctomycetaceae bacterium]